MARRVRASLMIRASLMKGLLLIVFVAASVSTPAQQANPAAAAQATPSATPTSAPTPAPTPTPSPLTELTPAPQVAQASGSAMLSMRPALIKIRVEYPSGDAKKPVALKRFFLLRNDLAASSAALPSRTSFYESIGASTELILWLRANDCESIYCRELTQNDLSVPEFRAAYERGVRRWRDSSRALKWLTINLPEPLRIGYYRLKTTSMDSLAARAGVVKTVVTNEKGVALLADVPPGDYYLSNLVPVEIGEACVLWNFRVTVAPGKTGKITTVTLDDDNAKSVACAPTATASRHTNAAHQP